MPNASVGYLGIYRDPETHLPVEYYCKVPPLINKDVFILDPMLATGASASRAVSIVKNNGAKEDRIFFVSLLSVPEGLQKLFAEQPKIQVFTAAVDEKLNAHDYIVPGLGDAGDRLYRTR